MTGLHSIPENDGRNPSGAPGVRPNEAKRPALGRRMRTGALCALAGLASSALVAPNVAEAAPPGAGALLPGSVVVAQGGTIFGALGSGKGKTVEANGEVVAYPANSNGDVAPEANFIKGMYGPVAMAFDPSGNLWVANVNIGTVIELTRSQLAKPNPMPKVTISAPSTAPQALAFLTGIAVDGSGDLWVVGNGAGKVYEYTSSQVAKSGSPTPQTTISDLPSTPLGDGFDPNGDLWVTTVATTNANKQPVHPCPVGCVVEFTPAELATADPAPSVTITSTGGANIDFTPSGNMWMVTGGGAAFGTPYCFGTPCTNELVEFTKAQLSSSGSPTPAVIISTTAANASGSMWGPYGVAIDPSGDVWVSNFNKPTAVEYSAYQLSQSGKPTPMRTIDGPDTGMNWPSYILIAP